MSIIKGDLIHHGFDMNDPNVFWPIGVNMLCSFTHDKYAANKVSVAGTDLLTCIRASTGLAERADGTLQEFAANELRTTDKGLLVEEARTNFLLHSSAFGNAAWTRGGGVVDSATTDIAPDGSVVPIWDINNTGQDYIYQDRPCSFGQTYTNSIYIKANKTVTLGLRYPGTGSSNTNDDIVVTDNWQRFSITSVASGSSSRLLLDARMAGGYGGQNLQLSFWGAQLEEGAFATSHIKTTSAAATRAEDRVQISDLSWLTPGVGTMLIEVENILLPNASSDHRRLIEFTGPSSARLAVWNETTASYVIDVLNNGGASQVSSTIDDSHIGTEKVAIAWATDDFAGVVDGGTVVVDTSCIIPSVNTGYVGQSATGHYHNGIIRQIVYWPERKTDAEMQGLTT